MASHLTGLRLLALDVVHNEQVDEDFATSLFREASRRSEGHSSATKDFHEDCSNKVVIKCDELPELPYRRKP